MKILIDGDGCPVIPNTIKIGQKHNLEVIILCDTAHNFSKYNVETIVISKGADSVDFALVNRVNKGDLVVTQDYGLAAMVLAKGGYAINQNGQVYNNENIDMLLFTRHLSKKVRNSGGRLKGPRKRDKEDDIRFEESIDNLLERINL